MKHRNRIVFANTRAAGEDRTLTFTASTEEVARDGDIIRVAGWETENFEKNPVFLWSHDGWSNPPIGRVTRIKKIQRGGKRLEIDVRFAGFEQMSELAEQVYLLYRDGFLNAVSVGFAPREAEEIDDAKRKKLGLGQFGQVWSRAELFEVSAVTVPSDPGALKQEGVMEAAIAVRSALPPEMAALWPLEGARVETRSESLTAIVDAVTDLSVQLETLGADLSARIDAVAGDVSEIRSYLPPGPQGETPRTVPESEDVDDDLADAIERKFRKD